MSSQEEVDGAIVNLCGLADTLRAEAQDLQKFLAPIVEAAKSNSPDLEAKIGQAGRCLDAKTARLDRFAGQVDEIFEEFPAARTTAGARLVQISSALGNARDVWPRIVVDPQSGQPVAPDPATIAASAEAASADLDELVYRASLLTITNRVNEELDSLGVGEPLNFTETFSEAIPDDERRARLLGYLKRHPRRVHGWVDSDKGLIYRTSQSAWFRVVTYIAPVLTFVAAAAVLYGVDLAHNNRSWSDALTQKNSFLVTFLAVLAGAVAHLSMARVKRIHFGGTDAEIIALGSKLTWLHLRWVSLCLSLVPVLITWGGMRWWSGSHTLITYFFAGYSVDSFAELFLGRLELAGGTAGRRMIEGLKAAGGKPASPNGAPGTP